MGKKHRVASISGATPREDGDGYDYGNQGAGIGDPDFPGSLSLILEVDHPTRKTEDGYPVRGKLIVGKYQFPPEEGSDECEEVFVDYTQTYLNMTVWEDIPRSPKAKGKK